MLCVYFALIYKSSTFFLLSNKELLTSVVFEWKIVYWSVLSTSCLLVSHLFNKKYTTEKEEGKKEER